MTSLIDQAPDSELEAPEIKWEGYTRESLLRRLFLVFLAVVLGILVDARWLPGLAPTCHVLRFLIFSSVSVVASQWLSWLVASVFLSSLWAVVVAVYRKPLGEARGFVGLLARNVGHLEAAFVWTALAAGIPVFSIMLPCLAAVYVLGLPVAERMAAGSWQIVRLSHPLARRRVAVAILTGLGYVALLARDWRQAAALVGLAPTYAFSIGARLGVLLLIVWKDRREALTEDEPDARAVRLARRYDLPVTAVAALAIYGSRAVPLVQALADDDRDRAHRGAMLSGAGGATGVAATGGVAVFIVSDGQFHELRGERSAAHFDLVDRVIPVAVRPVELDLLSGVPFQHFGELYRAMREQRRDLPWAHLGDFADLGCKSELDRAKKYVDAFAPDNASSLAGLVPGNHDSTFFGNFAWHPDWETVCTPEGRPLEAPPSKTDVNRWLASWMKSDPHAPRHVIPPDQLKRVSLFHPKAEALVSFRDLGEAAGVRVVGAFLDTSDYADGMLGVAGAQGTISTSQYRALEEALCSGGIYGKASMVLFMHHPRTALSSEGQAHLYDLADCLGERLLAVVSAHTHLAAPRKWPSRDVPELVVGSILDPPQEAALLTVTPKLAVRLETIPSVRRGIEPSIEGSVEVTLGDCTRVYTELDAREECTPLLHTRIDHREPSSTVELKRQQQERAHLLLECLKVIKLSDASVHDEDGTCFEGQPTGDMCPLSSWELYDRLDEVIQGDWTSALRKELVCLARAGALLQGHKENGWSFGKALERAGDPSADPPPIVIECPPGRAACSTQ